MLHELMSQIVVHLSWKAILYGETMSLCTNVPCTLDLKMFSYTIASIPVLTGTNWSNWWPKIKSAIMATGEMWIKEVFCPTLGLTSMSEEIQLYIKWTKVNMKMLDTICQTLSPAILHQYQDVHMASDPIKQLKDVYGTQGLSQVFVDFKAMMDTLIPVNGHLRPAFVHFQTLFTKLSQAQYAIPDNI